MAFPVKLIAGFKLGISGYQLQRDDAFGGPKKPATND
jgi:hypothetical protein